MKKVFVTGGNGYVGSHVTKILYESGYNPISFDRRAFERKWASPNWDSIHGDINDTEFLDLIFRTYNFDSVIHLAASSEIESSVKNPLDYYKNNVGGTASLLSVCNKYNVKKVVFSSTSSVYGRINLENLPTKESHPTNPITSYGSSKLAVESMFRDAEIAYGIRSVGLRYFNASGAAPDGTIGEWRENPSHLIPSLWAYIEGRRNYFSVFGNDYDTKDGTAVRDFSHVWDIAKAHINALSYLDNDKKSIILNIGAGSKGISVLEIIREFENQLNQKLDINYSSRRVGDIPINYADISLAKDVLGWTPTISNPFNIVRDAIKWYNSSLYKIISQVRTL